MDPNSGVVSPTDAQDDSSISTSSSQSPRSNRQQQPVLQTYEQGSGIRTGCVKQELERIERRNSIMDLDSGRISPPRTKGQWDAFIKRSVPKYVSGTYAFS